MDPTIHVVTFLLSELVQEYGLNAASIWMRKPSDDLGAAPLFEYKSQSFDSGSVKAQAQAGRAPVPARAQARVPVPAQVRTRRPSCPLGSASLRLCCS